MREETIRSLSTGELVGRLMDNVSSLIDREIDLAKQEGRTDVRQGLTGGASLTLALVLLYTGFIALIVAAIFALAELVGSIISALIIAGVFIVPGAILAAIGWTMVNRRPLERTRRTLREDVEWARDQTRSREK